MKPEVTDAVARLQARLAKTSNTFRGEVLEAALDHLVAKPDGTGTAAELMAAAITYAMVKLGRRRRLLLRYLEQLGAADDSGGSLGEVCVQVADIISKLPQRHQRVLTLAWVNNSDAEVLGAELGKSTDYARQSLSRARARARALWLNVA